MKGKKKRRCGRENGNQVDGGEVLQSFQPSPSLTPRFSLLTRQNKWKRIYGTAHGREIIFHLKDVAIGSPAVEKGKET